MICTFSYNKEKSILNNIGLLKYLNIHTKVKQAHITNEYTLYFRTVQTWYVNVPAIRIIYIFNHSILLLLTTNIFIYLQYTHNNNNTHAHVLSYLRSRN